MIVGITVAGTVAYYTWTTFLPTYAQQNVSFDKGRVAHGRARSRWSSS